MKTIFPIIIAVALSLVIGSFVFKDGGNHSAAKETAYERVMRTGTIRCGYGISEPWLYVDPNTKAIKGLAHDVIEEIAKNLNLKVEWTEETGWGGIVPALNSQRIDVGCSSMWMVAVRTREIMYSNSYMFNVLNAYTRAGENKLTTKDSMNKPDVRFSVVDGEVTDEIFKAMFPNAKSVALPVGSGGGQSFQDIITNKADVVVYDPFAVRTFNEKSDVKLAKIPLPEPLMVWGSGFPVAKGEYQLKHMLDTAIFELITKGKLQEIIAKYTKGEDGLLYPPIKQFATEKE
jgi:polar amino acid transport system substrate-binding protein